MKKKLTFVFDRYFKVVTPVSHYLFVLFFLLSVFNLQAQEKRIFTVGNSVTDGVNFEGFKSLAESRGYIHTLARHMIPGAPLDFLWNRGFPPYYPDSAGFFTEPYGTPPYAFPGYTWDAISLQPFDRLLEGADQDREVAKRYIDLARSKSPEVQVYIYSRYPRAPQNAPLTADLWNNLWLRNYTGGWDNTNETRDYFQRLVTVLRNDYAATSLKPVMMIPLGEVMYSLNNKMKNGQVSGYSNIWQFYSDGIHVNNVGSYVVACTFFATIYKESPVGLPVPSQYGTIGSTLRATIQQTVWEVVTAQSSWTGVTSGNVPVTGVSVTPSSLSLAINQTGQLSATIAPSNATNKTVAWSSSNAAIATVSSTGLVTGRAAGTATITVTTQDGGKTATAGVTVTSTSVPVTGVSVSPTSVTVNTGNTTALTATVSPSNATNKNVTWSSSNASVATVSNAGVVTGVSQGSATITVRTQDGNRTATSAITVTANSKPVARITANPTSGTAPLVVQFSASSSSDPDPGDFILGFDWDFGDGTPRANSNAPSHTYTNAGTYTVTLRVMDNHDTYSDPVSTTITVNPSGGTYTKVTGTAFGTGPWSGCATCTFDKAFDNNTSTFFDAATGSGGYTGIDAGSARVVKRIRFYPRAGYEGRMVGGKFQGSNTSSSAGFVDLYTISSTPSRAWQQIDLGNNTGYRYLRYLGPNEGYGNVAEVEFYVSTTTPPPPSGNWVKIENTASGWTTNSVTTWPDAQASGGNSWSLWKANDYVQYTFTGTQVRVYGIREPGMVTGDIYIDNVLVADDFPWSVASTAHQQLVWQSATLSNAPHTIRIVSSGDYVDVDYITVLQGSAALAAKTQEDDAKLAIDRNLSMNVSSDPASNGKSKLTVYPNPVIDGTLNVSFISKVVGRGSISLTNALGVKVLTNSVSVVEGENKFQMAAAGLAPGMYIFAFELGEVRLVEKVFIN